MNTNLIHNIINLALVTVSAVATFDWSTLVSPELAVKVVGVLGVLKLTINGLRDGIGGLVKNQPPVQ